MAAPTDHGLLARAVAGDGTAFAALVDPYQRAVFRHCYRMLGSGADAEDATQDTLERAWRRLATYDGSGPLGAWLQRIATNVCLDGLRARRTRIGPAGYGPPAAPGTVPGPAGGPKLAGPIRVRLARSPSRQTLVAIRCSQAPSGPDPS